MTEQCANCGFERKEHSYNGACYGICGEFVDRSVGDRLSGYDPKHPFMARVMSNLDGEKDAEIARLRETNQVLHAEVVRLRQEHNRLRIRAERAEEELRIEIGR